MTCGSLAALTCALAWVLLAEGRADATGSATAAGFERLPAKGVGQQGRCPRPAKNLIPSDSPTLIYRVQHPWDAERLARLRVRRPLDFPIARRDVFLVRARAVRVSAARRMVDSLRRPTRLSGELFRCNRILAMTGVDDRPGREYVYNLLHNPDVWSVGVDWEKLMFDHAYAGGGPQWSDQLGPNVTRLGAHAGAIRRAGKRPGGLVAGWHGWNHAELARGAGLGYQVVQTQDVCKAGAGSYASRARTLLGQYRAAGLGISNLAMQVSFNSHPGKTPFVNDVTPGEAAACTVAAYDAGVRGFLLWGPPDALDNYFERMPNRVRGAGCTLSGDAGRDVLRGTDNRDVICGFGGRDRIYGRGGNDTLLGGGGADKLYGGAGDDWLRGGAGNDLLHGGVGLDLCARGAGRDKLTLGCDRLAPRLKSPGVAVAPGVANVSGGPGALAVAAWVKDDMAGFDGMVLRFRSPSGAHHLQARVDHATPYSGTRRDGVIAGILAVPHRSEPGRWKLNRVSIWDRAGNARSLNSVQLRDAGFRAGFDSIGV